MATARKSSQACDAHEGTAGIFRVFDLTLANLGKAFGVAFSTGLTLLASFMVGRLIDLLVGGAASDNIFISGACALVAAVASAASAVLLVTWLPLKTGIARSMSAATDVVRGLLGSSQRAFGRHDKGYYVNVLTNSTSLFGTMYGNVSVSLLGSSFCIAVVVMASFLLEPLYAVAILVYIPLFVCALLVPTRRLARLQREGLPTQDAFLGESKRIVEDKRSIAAISAERYFSKRYKDRAEAYLRFVVRYKFNETLIANLPAVLSCVLQVALMGLAVLRCAEGSLGVGGIFVAYQLAVILQAPLVVCLQAFTHWRANVVHQERLVTLSRESAEPSGFEGLYRGRGAGVELGPCALYATPRARAEGRPLFSCAGLSVPGGSLVVVKGANGTGKSMLLDFLRGLSDPADLDGEASMGEALRDAPYLTYPVPLVSGTLEDNLLGAAADPAAAAALGVSSLAGKEFDERVVNVSFGERQKLGLLRVLSAPGGALLLDEPLQNLDEGAQGRVCAYVAGLRGRRTVFAVMHSDGLDEAADLVLEIRDHELVCVKGR